MTCDFGECPVDETREYGTWPSVTPSPAEADRLSRVDGDLVLNRKPDLTLLARRELKRNAGEVSGRPSAHDRVRSRRNAS
jgi:hypothetical protein